MEHSYEDIVLLERYIERSLGEEEIMRVKKRLTEEVAFRELYNHEKLLVHGIRYGHLKSRLSELKELEAGLPAIESQKTGVKVIELKPYWKVMAAAASVAMAISVLLFLNRPISPEQMYTDNFEHYPNIFQPTTRGSENVAEEAYIAYDNEDFQKAADGFTKMLKQDLPSDEREEVLLLLGNCNLMLNNTEAARDNFITLHKEYDRLDHQAKWFLSLCYLKQGKKDSAKVLLEEISSEEGGFRDRAKELLKDLK